MTDKTLLCVGCEGSPAPENTPCAVCGAEPAPAPVDSVERVRAWCDGLDDLSGTSTKVYSSTLIVRDIRALLAALAKDDEPTPEMIDCIARSMLADELLATNSKRDIVEVWLDEREAWLAN